MTFDPWPRYRPLQRWAPTLLFLTGMLWNPDSGHTQGLAKEYMYSGGRLVAVEIAASSNDFGTVSMEYWTGISGSTVPDLTGDSAYPNSPSGAGRLSAFEARTNWGENYGQRVRGYLMAPKTGHYTFYIASSNASQLWLSSDADPANVTMIASVASGVVFRNWFGDSSQSSSAIYLVGGRQYYIEALHKAGTGPDHLSVAWNGPGVPFRVIQGEYLSPWEEYDAPIVTIENPFHWQSFASSNIPLNYTATDDVAVTSCEIQFAMQTPAPFPDCSKTVLSYVHLPDSNKFLGYDFANGPAGPAYDRAIDSEANNGTLTGVDETTSPGHGKALHFGSGDGIAPASPDPGHLHNAFTHRTFEAWFKADSTSGRHTIFDEGGAATGFWLAIDNNAIKFATRASSVQATASYSFTDTSSWHHVAAVFDNGAMTLYLDGTSVATQTASFSTVPGHGNEPGIGRTVSTDAGNGSAASHYLGALDEVAIYSRALSAAEVASHASNSYFAVGLHNITVSAFDGDSNVGSDTHVFEIQ